MLKNIALEKNEENFNWTHGSMYPWWNPPQYFQKLNKLKWVHKIKQSPLVPHHGAPSYNQRIWSIKYLCGGPFVKVMKTNGIHMPQFKGFMVDNAQVNWNVVWIVFYPFGDPTQPLPNKKRTCFFHLVQSMEIHTNRLIWVPHLKAKHMEICNHYKNSKTFDEATAKFEVLRSWWLSFNIVIGTNLEKINHWLAFWHFLTH